jgi:polysaccharide pyruvyl transferase WcaK-like protein
MTAIRIIVDTALNEGPAEYQNMGDVAMLQIAVNRLMRMWPSASIEVLTESPENLTIYCPKTKPLSRAGRDLWVGDSFLVAFLGRFHDHLPRWIAFRLMRLIRAAEIRWPALVRLMIRLRLSLRDHVSLRFCLIPFLKAMERVDLFVVSGAGGFADSCRAWNMAILGILESAIERKIPVAMFGQGIGPLNDQAVLSRAKNVLPAVDFISLRGGLGGLTLLESLGVDVSNVLTTGDEAIELAYEARSEQPGQALGINLRVASYSGIDKGFIEKLRPVFQQFAKEHDAPILPLPIAVHPYASDHETIRLLLRGFDDRSDGGLALDTPLKVIEHAGRCRVVVSGAYHAAVFALAQGIPVVCLSKSAYYDAKFRGLEDQFGLGCETVSLNDPYAVEKLAVAIERAWQSAERVRLPLQQAALRQIELCRGAYERVRGLLDTRRAQRQSIYHSGF